MNIFEHLKQVKLLELSLFGIDVSITNGVVVMFFAVVLIVLPLLTVVRRSKLIPTPAQSAVEYLIDFIRKEMLAPLGPEGEIWVPFILSLFLFILTCNLLGVIPGIVPPTSNINVTATMALIIFALTHIVGIWKHGLAGYLQLIVPPGLPLPVALFLFPIELIGQLARPFSLAVRLFANMFAGHAIVLMLISLIFIFRSYLVVPFPVIGNTAIMGFEIFVSFIQAFIFTYLSASYIVGALQTEH